MPDPAPTQLLAEDLHGLCESNQRIAARLDAAFREPGRDLGNLRSDVEDRPGAINTNLERAQAGIETQLRFIGRTALLVFPVVLSLLGAALWLTWHANRFNARPEPVEPRLEKPAVVALANAEAEVEHP